MERRIIYNCEWREIPLHVKPQQREYLLSLSCNLQLRNSTGCSFLSWVGMTDSRPTSEASLYKMNSLLTSGLCSLALHSVWLSRSQMYPGAQVSDRQIRLCLFNRDPLRAQLKKWEWAWIGYNTYNLVIVTLSFCHDTRLVGLAFFYQWLYQPTVHYVSQFSTRPGDIFRNEQ